MRKTNGDRFKRTRVCGLGAAATTLLLAAGVALGPSRASASSTQQSIFNDPVLYGSPDRWDTQIPALKAMGVERFLLILQWKNVAPDPGSKTVPSALQGGGGTSPSDYPSSQWWPYDRFISLLRDNGIAVSLNISGPAPRWANKGGSKAKRGFSSVDPSTTYFGRFAQAVGSRYPSVDQWSCWNEPNLASWLTPQIQRMKAKGVKGKVSVPISARIYRNLFNACVQGLTASGNGGDSILLGETSPRAPTGSAPPADFIRELLCLDPKLKPYVKRDAVVHGCGGTFKQLPATGFAHHPYLLGITPFTKLKGARKSWIPINGLSRLTKILDAGARYGRIKPNLPVHLTEFGVQSNPPDKGFGVSPPRQAEYINIAERIAYTNPRVVAMSQYEYCDPTTSGASSLGGFQTGLLFADCTPKPALDAYRLPISVRPGGMNAVTIWGGVRPVTVGQPRSVTVEAGVRGSFSPVGDPVQITNSKGYFRTTVSKPAAATFQWRLKWTNSSGTVFYSRPAVPTKRW